MKLGLISDIHATLPALDAVLAALDAEGVDRIVCLGDVVDMGPQPIEVLERLESLGIPCVRGNHDRLEARPAFPLLAAVEDWTLAKLGPDRVAAMRAWPTRLWVDLDGLRVLCVHGSPRADTDDITDDTPWDRIDGWADGQDHDVLVCGHTHVQLVRRDGHRTVVNVGSVSQPFARPFRGTPPRVLPFCDFAVVEGSAAVGASVHLRRIPVPFDEFVRALRATDFPEQEQWLTQWSR